MYKILTILLLVTSLSAFSDDEMVDSSPNETIRSGMHACPEGWYMSGAHLGWNDFSCLQKNDYSYVIEDEFIDKRYVHNGMHSCPNGYAMTGFNKSKNLLLCAPLSAPSGKGGLAYRLKDNPPNETMRNRMHTCPNGLPMVGIHVGNNQFSCQYNL